MGIADDYTRFTLRIPETLHKKLLKRSRDNKRSLNSEIISILECEEGMSEKVLESKLNTLPSDQKQALQLIINALQK